MTPTDPFPSMSQSEARQLLSKRYGEKTVHWDQPFGPVFIQLKGSDGTVRVRRFTWQQAKYLAGQPMNRDDVVSRRYPRDWPA